MSLRDLVNDSSAIRVSFEFSPPKTDEAEQQLWACIRRLEPLSPAFVSVTYGAGGSTRDRTHATVKRIVEETTLKPAAHLTCVAHPRREIDEIIEGYWKAGVRHIVALRGDMPNIKGIARMAAKAGASVPEWLTALYRGLEKDPETRRVIAATVLAEQVEELRALGFDEFHFYTLNQADLTYATCRILGLKPNGGVR